ncbi:hypothetical protein BC826DRAFT_39435 [Russula brevipes]|nr:hypothetical protein BC826DRAFT_39435 [Russula brevipes]
MDQPYLTPGSLVTSQNSGFVFKNDIQRGHSVYQIPLNRFQPQTVELGSSNGLVPHTVPANLSYASYDPVSTRPLEAPGGASPSQPTEEIGQSGLQPPYTDTTSPPRKLPDTVCNPVVANIQNSTMRRASQRQHERKLEDKRERDKRRKRNERSKDAQDYARICELLKIEPTPHKTLANRILRAVEDMVAQKKLDENVRRQLQVAESEAAFLSDKLAQLQTRTALLVAPAFPSTPMFLVDSDTQVEALVSNPSVSWSESNGQGTEQGWGHN